MPTIGDCHHGTHWSQWRDRHCPAGAEVSNVVAFIGTLADIDDDADRINVMADVQSSITTHMIGHDDA